MWPRSLQTGTTATSSPPHGMVPFVWYQGGWGGDAAGRVSSCEFGGGGLVIWQNTSVGEHQFRGNRPGWTPSLVYSREPMAIGGKWKDKINKRSARYTLKRDAHTRGHGGQNKSRQFVGVEVDLTARRVLNASSSGVSAMRYEREMKWSTRSPSWTER